MTVHDPRLHAFRADLADIRLKGGVTAERFVAGEPARVAVPVADLRRQPDRAAGVDTQFVLGDDVLVFDRRGDWAWVQAERDGYVGYVEATALGTRELDATHIVSVPRSFIYPTPDLRFPRKAALSMGSAVTVTGEAETRRMRYLTLADGSAMIAAHLQPAGVRAADFVAVAERFIDTPYLWGGNTGFGIDCSGLVQLSLRMCGVDVLRDTDMQQATIGDAFDPGDYSGCQRGDLVFWKGHVAIMTDADTMLHANGHTMLVSRERLDEAVARIGYLYGRPTGFRRL